MKYKKCFFNKVMIYSTLLTVNLFIMSGCTPENPLKSDSNFSTNSIQSNSKTNTTITSTDLSNSKYIDYGLDELVREFSPENILLKKAISDKIFNIALDTTTKNNYSLEIEKYYFEDDSSFKDLYFYKNGTFKTIVSDPFGTEKTYVNLFLPTENALYSYCSSDSVPVIEKFDDYLSDAMPLIKQPGRLGNVYDFDFSLTDYSKLEWIEMNNKKILHFYMDSLSVILENFIDPETGFSILRRESYLTSDGVLIPNIEVRLINCNLNPEFNDIFTLPITKQSEPINIQKNL